MIRHLASGSQGSRRDRVRLRLRARVALAGCLLPILAACLALELTAPDLHDGLHYSSAVYDRRGSLLRLTTTPDGKRRLRVPLKRLSPLLIEATLLHEDRFFRLHPGVNPVALARAALESYILKTRRRGASTLTMQLARIRWGLETRAIRGKALQILRALQLEWRYSKDELLEAYFALAPYGGNIEGAGAASLALFGKGASDLSLGEALTLAVLPQSPSLRAVPAQGGLNPGLHRARIALFDKWIREHPGDRGFRGLLEQAEPIGAPIPFRAPHFVEKVLQEGGSGEIFTGLDLRLQDLLERQVREFVSRRRDLGVRNAAALLVDTRDLGVRALVGSAGYRDASISGQVNGTAAKRSPGSALKPFVYALAIEQGLIHPETMLKDAPASFGDFNPENFDGEFVGPVHATQALNLSRNVPAVDLASRLEGGGLHALLARAGITALRDPEHYGLALVLGGVELSMEELTALYAALANGGRHGPLAYRVASPPAPTVALVSPEAAFMTLDMLRQSRRPDQSFRPDWLRDRGPVAWKTGTSHGFRDAWTMGVFGRYVLAVWLGHFNGQGNPAFVGRELAGRLFFQVVDGIRAEEGKTADESPAGHPSPRLVRLGVCAVSGALPGPHCARQRPTWYLPGVSPIAACELHRAVILDAVGRRRCGVPQPGDRLEVFEFWPSDLARLFSRAGLPRKEAPGFPSDCPRTSRWGPGQAPRITSPRQGMEYQLRLHRDGRERVPLTAVADGDSPRLFWFANGAFLGQALSGDTFFWHARPGKYVIRVVDEQGRSHARDLRVGAER